MSEQFQSYAQFNTMTVTGRIFAIEVPQGRDFLAVTLISNIESDKEVTFTFTNSNGIKALFEKGYLPTGRMLTITGHISGVSEVYTKEGVTKLRRRPEIHLTGVQIPTGGLGPIPNKDRNNKQRAAAGTVVELDNTPSTDEEAPY